MAKIENKIIVITGGNKGFGKSLASTLIGKGNKVVAVGRSAQEKSDGNYFEMIGDVTVEADMKKVVEDVVAKFGQIDIWINNAGKWVPHGPVEDLDMDRVRDVFDVNVFGLMNGSKQALIQMRKQEQGIILNILSTAALDGRAQASIYRSSKFAADGFTKCLRDEVKESNIKVFSVYPGGMKTNLFDEKRPDNFDEYMDPDDVVEKIIANMESNATQEKLVIKREGQGK